MSLSRLFPYVIQSLRWDFLRLSISGVTCFKRRKKRCARLCAHSCESTLSRTKTFASKNSQVFKTKCLSFREQQLKKHAHFQTTYFDEILLLEPLIEFIHIQFNLVNEYTLFFIRINSIRISEISRIS